MSRIILRKDRDIILWKDRDNLIVIKTATVTSECDYRLLLTRINRNLRDAQGRVPYTMLKLLHFATNVGSKSLSVATGY